jgi:hypothetical protein
MKKSQLANNMADSQIAQKDETKVTPPSDLLTYRNVSSHRLDVYVNGKLLRLAPNITFVIAVEDIAQIAMYGKELHLIR